ncbi:alpha-amylase family glycosyl hydrolase [Pedobacter sp. SAFR-022]|uniref:alpha-amylase family glycosyl hydrolase n=1 Tax=Pedobacter sp. SAFR-022 TaxID=3436861 RepID=UPI003F7F27FF
MNFLKSLILNTMLLLCFGTAAIAQQQSSSTSFIIPDRRDVSLYQVNTRAFSAAGDLKSVTARLDSIKALGINVIYLMPLYPVGRENSVNSPYCIRDYTAIAEEFGNIEDLKTLVNTAHQKQMGVLMDWVANHTAFDHAWTKNKSWYKQDSTGKIISPPGTGWNDVAQLNFDNKDMRVAMIASMKFWLNNANIDGFRCDYSDGPPYDFWKEAVGSLRAAAGKRKLLMLSEGTRTDHFKAGFDYNFGFRFFENLKNIYEHGKSVRSIDSLNAADLKDALPGQQYVRYTSNHDVNSSDGTSLELFGGKDGELAAFVVVSCMQSIPMLYNGQEVGTPKRISFPFTTTKIDWNINPEHTSAYKKIINFRNSNEIIRRGQLKSFSDKDVCVFTKQLDGKTVLVIANLRNKALSYSLQPVLAKHWKDAFSGKKQTLATSVSLAPYQYMILTSL